MRPKSLEEAVRLISEGLNWMIAINEFLDEFYLSAKRQTMIDAQPPLTGNVWLDAYVGGVGEHLARRWSLRIPKWTDDPHRFLETPSFPDKLELSKPVLLRDSPIAFRRRMIFTEAEPLRRGRFPTRG
jgi:hypothetical protein